MHGTFVVVIRFSAASGDLWPQLATGLDVEFRGVAPGDMQGIPNAAAVVLAAGGVERDALGWLQERSIPADVPVFVVGADTSRRIVAQLVRLGVTDYFALPEDSELLHNALAAAIARRNEAVRRTPQGSPDARKAFAALAGDHPAFTAALERAATLASYPRATALIIGEEGTGKELLARSMHKAGVRRGAPFVAVSCSSLPSHLVEAELFGYEQGSAESPGPRPGLIEIADGGTLFLDEVGALPLDVQARLLRLLETWETTRVGATRTRPVDLRVIAASSEDLEGAIRRGAFRHDLALRLGVVVITMPPLRERHSDVLIIAARLLEDLAARHDLPVPDISGDARRALEEHRWPGNVRELKHALERGLLLSPAGQINVAELFPRSPLRSTPPGGIPFPAELDDITSAAASAMLNICSGNLSEAARRLNISRSRLRRLLKSQSSTHLTQATA